MTWWRRRRGKRTSVSTQPPRNGPAAYHENPDVITMTQGVTYRAGGFGFDETIGLAGAASILDAAAAGAVADRSLHATGKVCPRCGRAFTGEDPARRLVTGELVHDVC